MKTVNIVETFTLTRNDGSMTRYTPGLHEIEDEYADFWYVLAHSDHPPSLNPPVGTKEYADQERRKIARRKVLDAATEELAAEAEAKDQVESTETTRRRIIDTVTRPTERKNIVV